MSDRNPKRLDTIRKMICCECGADAPSQAAHSNFMCHGKGKGIKADDRYTIPLCYDDHHRFDTYNMGMNRQESFEWFLQKWRETNRLLKWQNRRLEQNGADF